MPEKRDCMLFELDVLLENLADYRAAIANNDFNELSRLPDEGRLRKELVDGR